MNMNTNNNGHVENKSRTNHFFKHIEDVMRSHDIEQYAYFVINKKDMINPDIFSNYPKKWLQAYKELNFHTKDPIILYGLKTTAPFNWLDAINDISSNQKYFLSLADKFALSQGYSFNLHDPKGNFALLSVTKTTNDRNFNDLLTKYKSDFQMLLIELHNEYLSTFEHQKDNFELIKSMQITAREKEILSWSSKGKTYSEIAIIIGITERTVKFHMANIVKKLGVCNAKHAIYKAKELELI